MDILKGYAVGTIVEVSEQVLCSHGSPREINFRKHTTPFLAAVVGTEHLTRNWEDQGFTVLKLVRLKPSGEPYARHAFVRAGGFRVVHSPYFMCTYETTNKDGEVKHVHGTSDNAIEARLKVQKMLNDCDVELKDLKVVRVDNSGVRWSVRGK